MVLTKTFSYNIFMKKLAIFDLDGTLINTIADLATATNFALSQQGYPTHETNAYLYFVGNGINKLFERALPENKKSQENILKTREIFVPYYDVHNTDLSVPYDGIEEVLKALQAKGMMLAVASNKYDAATKKLIKHYFPDIKFIAVLGQREQFPTKPNPAVINEIIELANVTKEEVVYVGDSGVDMQTGINAGVCTIGVAWGFRPKSELESYKPTYIAEERRELPQIILSE